MLFVVISYTAANVFISLAYNHAWMHAKIHKNKQTPDYMPYLNDEMILVTIDEIRSENQILGGCIMMLYPHLIIMYKYILVIWIWQSDMKMNFRHCKCLSQFNSIFLYYYINVNNHSSRRQKIILQSNIPH